MPLSRYQKYIVAIIPLVLILFVAYFFSGILTYVILAWILSMIGGPIHNRLRPLIGSTGAAILTLFTFSIITLTIIYIFIPPIIQQARNFSNIDYNKVFASIEEPIEDWNEWLIEKGILDESESVFTPVKDTIESTELPWIKVMRLDSLLGDRDSLHQPITIIVQVNHPKNESSEELANHNAIEDTFVDRARKNLMAFLNPARISQVLSSIFGALGNTLIGVMSVFFITFFFLKEQGLFTNIVRAISPDDQEEKWGHAFEESGRLLKRYFIGVAVQIIIITVFVSTALSLLGFENALLIGFFAALMNVIPYLGPLLGATFGIIITISSNLPDRVVAASRASGVDLEEVAQGDFYNELLPKIGLLVLVFALMQLFDNFILQPNIFSKSVKAHPLEIFIIILVGAQLGGVLGMVVAIPLYTIFRVIAKVFLSEFKIVQSITRGI